MLLFGCLFEDDKYVSTGEGSGRGVSTALPDGALPDGRTPGGGGDGDGDGDGSGLEMAFDGGFLPDGAPLGGGDDDDAGTAGELDVSGCSVAADEGFEISVPTVEGGFALTPGTVDFGLAYLGEGNCAGVIDTAIVPSLVGSPSPRTIIDDCRTIVELSLVSSADRWFMAWTDNSADRVELFSAQLGDDLSLGEATRTRVTDNMAFERRPKLADIAGNAVLAWVEEETGGQRPIKTRVLGADGGSEAIVIAGSDGRLPIELAIAQMGEERGALAWVEEIANQGVWLQPLDGEGKKAGTPRQMTPYAAPGSTVDLATRERDGGATIYSIGIDQVSFEVRFRRLDEQADFWGEEVKVIGRPLQGKDAGIARLGGGYVVAYRAIPDGNTITSPQVRLAFVTKEGNVTKDPQGRVVTFPVAPATRDGSQIQVKVSVDGQIMLAFVDGSSADSNTLRIIRRRLDCGG
ncbi:MAG: hypothetical protein PVI30_04475 [Myxococcales bacterium]